MQLPEVKLKVTTQHRREAEQPRLQKMTTTTSLPTRKRKKLEYSRFLLQWFDAHFQRSSKNCRQKSTEDRRHGAETSSPRKVQHYRGISVRFNRK